MSKPISELLGYITKQIEYLEEDISSIDMKEEPNTYWYVRSGIEVYQAVAQKIEEEYL